MASVREAVEKVLLVFKAGEDYQRFAAWTAEKARMEAAYTGGVAAIASCELRCQVFSPLENMTTAHSHLWKNTPWHSH